MPNWRVLVQVGLTAICLDTAAADLSASGSHDKAVADMPTAAAIDRQVLMRALQRCSPPSAREAADGPHFQVPKLLSETSFISANQPGERVHQAVFRLYILIDALGNIRFAHIGYALPSHPEQPLADAAVRMIRRARMSPLLVNGHATASWVSINSERTAGGGVGLLRRDEWKKLLRKAHDGDYDSIRAAAVAGELVPGSGLDQTAILGLLADSALRGDDFARLDLVGRLSACSEGALVDQWVFADANAGSLAAELWWAQFLIGSGDPTVVPKASELLHKLAASPDEFMRLWSAGLLATIPMEAMRDPKIALQVAEALNQETGPAHTHDPDYAELLAAAEAANGQYPEAVQSERRAIEWATALNWKTGNMQSRLSTYLANKAYLGYLCDCDKLAPNMYWSFPYTARPPGP